MIPITLILLIVAYLLGSIQTGLWIGLVFYHKDIRTVGSGNTGTTNTFRALGVKAGVVTFIVDLLKGTAATLLPLLFHGLLLPSLIFGLCAVLGHTFPAFTKFKGGKAVATSGGVVLGYNPLFLVYLLIVFVIILFLFSMISASSIAAALAAVVGIVAFPAFHFILPTYDWLFSLIIFTFALIIIIRHRSNISRIRAHTESLLPLGLNLCKQKKLNPK